MQPTQLTKTKPGPATQKYLDITEIRQDCVILKDGTLRAILLVSSINFALKSEDEQKAIIAAYTQFLNALEYPLQIVLHSRKLDIKPYLSMLQEKEKEQTNELLAFQMADYREFVTELVEMGEIMTKYFYVIVPYDPFSDKRKGFFQRAQELFIPAGAIRLREELFQQRRKALLQRVEYIMMGLNSMGLSAAVLDTQSLIELFYNLYNPSVAKNQKMANVGELRVE